MSYDNYSPAANKYLMPDGSIVTFDGVEVLPANADRAKKYNNYSPQVAKWLLPDGSIVNALPINIGTTQNNFMVTPEGGYAIKMVNKTGSNSVKGSVVSVSSTTDVAFKLQENEFDAFGIVYDNGIADGQECYVVIAGVAQVLLKDSTASTRGNWVVAADTDGRANATQPTPFPNNTLGEHTLHFKEIGHCLETKEAGTSVLAKCIIHFN